MDGCRRGWGWLVVSLGLLACGADDDEFRCIEDGQCSPKSALSEPGRCEATGYCSFPDPQCASGRRYGDLAPSNLARFCVPPEDMGATGETGGSDGSGGGTPGTSCGNGILDDDEACDGTELGSATCESEGFAGGALGCTPACELDTSTCNSCGNGSIESGEACDGDNLGAVSTCADVGLGDATEQLRCSDGCELDYAECSACGDGVITAPEQCDSDDVGGTTCDDLGFDGGVLGCSAGCGFDTTGCAACGNNVREAGEACDGPDVGDATCQNQGFETGVLQCSSCELDTSGCSTCGDGLVTGAETCDPANPASLQCAAHGFDSGVVDCVDCQANTAACGTCGNGALDGAEECDQIDLGNTECDDLGFFAGELACANDCTFDTSSCDGEGCGDGIINGTEDCDGTLLGGAECETLGLGYAGGDLGCSGCEYDVSGCYACGDGEVNPGETCDDGDVNNGNQCSNGCEYNTVDITMVTGGNNAIWATLEASCPLTGTGCSMEAVGTLASWEAMENPGCTFSCPIDATIQIQCTTGGMTNRELEDIEEVGLGGQSSSCGGAEQYDCSTTFDVGSANMTVRCSYTD